MNALGGCGCATGIESVGHVSPDGLGHVNPDGLGATLAEVAPTLLLGYGAAGAVGYFLAPKKHRVLGAALAVALCMVVPLLAGPPPAGGK